MSPAEWNFRYHVPLPRKKSVCPLAHSLVARILPHLYTHHAMERGLWYHPEHAYVSIPKNNYNDSRYEGHAIADMDGYEAVSPITGNRQNIQFTEDSSRASQLLESARYSNYTITEQVSWVLNRPNQSVTWLFSQKTRWMRDWVCQSEKTAR
jgi:hypothetical protein